LPFVIGGATRARDLYLSAPILVAMAGSYSRSVADSVGIHFCTVEFAAHFQCSAQQPFTFSPTSTRRRDQAARRSLPLAAFRHIRASRQSTTDHSDLQI
jgi:hypothetical protein